MKIAAILLISAVQFLSFSASITLPALPLKDGDASAFSYDGSDKVLYIDGSGTTASVAWIVFQTENLDLTQGAELVFQLKSLTTPGSFSVKLLKTAVNFPENNVRLSDLAWDTASAAQVALSSADVEKVIKVDLTDALSKLTGTFFGIVLVSEDGLSATISSKEGVLKPLLYVKNVIDSLGTKWLTGEGVPADSIGRKDDMYLNTLTSDVYCKADSTWSLKANIRGADGVNGINGTNGTNGTDGKDGTGFVWRGLYNSRTLYAINDVVQLNGNSYIAVAPTSQSPEALCIKNCPWQLLAGSGTSSWADGAGTVSTNDNVSIDGDLTVNGTIRGRIDVSQVQGLVGQGYTVQFPDVYNNAARIEIEGLVTTKNVIVITGPGIDIERIPIWGNGAIRYDESGFCMEHPFTFETDGPDAITLKAFFDGYAASPSPKNMLLYMHDLAGNEKMRFEFSRYAPQSYTAASDGRTRFTFISTKIPSSAVRITAIGNYSFQPVQLPSITPDVDKGIEIEGVIGDFAAPVLVDTVNMTLTIDFAFGEAGVTLWNWTKTIATQGTSSAIGRRAMSVIDIVPVAANGSYTYYYNETGRMNYFEVFPIRWEYVSGFGLDSKAAARIVIAYGFRERG